MGKQYEELGITDAFMFAKVMSNKEICKPVLEQILNIKIRDIEYLDYEETIQIAPGSKSIRLDIYVEDDKNTVFNLEMQTTNYEELPKRSRYYQDIIGLKLIEKGQSYDILKTSYVIFICTFDFFEKNRSIYEFENICVDDSDIKLNDGTHKIFLNTKGNRDGISEELQMLLDYFDGREPESQLAKDIDRKVFEARNNKQWRREYMSYQMELDRQYRNGREEGIKEGMEKGSELATENINKLLKILIVEKKYDEIEKISENKEYQKELMKKYNVKKEITYKLQKGVSVATSTPTIYIVDKEGKIQFVTDEISQMLTKLYDLQYEKEEIIRQMADNYLKEKYQSGEKPLLVYFAMDGCSDCEAANPIIEGEKIQDKYQVVTIYREKDKGKEIIDTYSLLKRVYEITWYPSFVILDKETRIIGETPLQELETLLL